MLVPIPADLPIANPTESYWQVPPSDMADHRTTASLPTSASYVIIGSGVTGASIAYKLLEREPSADIVLLEARSACSGATGRNGGHCKTGRYLTFARDTQLYGKEEAIKMSRFEEENVRSLRNLVEENSIECDMEAVETVDVFYDTFVWEEAKAAVQARQKTLSHDIKDGHFHDVTVHNAEETKNNLRISSAAGTATFSAWTLHPYKLVSWMLKFALRKGLNLQTNTPVLSIITQLHSSSVTKKQKWIVNTESGQIIADQVILATNAYTSHLYPAVGKYLIPTRAQIAAQRPGSALMKDDPLLARSYGFFTRGGFGDYMISRPRGSSVERDVIMGGGRALAEGYEQPITDDSSIQPIVSDYLRHGLTTLFGKENWGDPGKVLSEWTGIMGYTVDGEPIIGEVPTKKGLWVCAGFNGHGMALAFQSAEALVSMLLGESDEQLDSWVPKAFRLSRFISGQSAPVARQDHF